MNLDDWVDWALYDTDETELWLNPPQPVYCPLCGLKRSRWAGCDDTYHAAVQAA